MQGYNALEEGGGFFFKGLVSAVRAVRPSATRALRQHPICNAPSRADVRPKETLTNEVKDQRRELRRPDQPDNKREQRRIWSVPKDPLNRRPMVGYLRAVAHMRKRHRVTADGKGEQVMCALKQSVCTSSLYTLYARLCSPR